MKAERRADWALFWGESKPNEFSGVEHHASKYLSWCLAWRGTAAVPYHSAALADFRRFSLWEADQKLCFGSGSVSRKPEMSWKLNAKP